MRCEIIYFILSWIIREDNIRNDNTLQKEPLETSFFFLKSWSDKSQISSLQEEIHIMFSRTTVQRKPRVETLSLSHQMSPMFCFTSPTSISADLLVKYEVWRSCAVHTENHCVRLKSLHLSPGRPWVSTSGWLTPSSSVSLKATLHAAPTWREPIQLWHNEEELIALLAFPGLRQVNSLVQGKVSNLSALTNLAEWLQRLSKYRKHLSAAINDQCD